MSKASPKILLQATTSSTTRKIINSEKWKFITGTGPDIQARCQFNNYLTLIRDTNNAIIETVTEDANLSRIIDKYLTDLHIIQTKPPRTLTGRTIVFEVYYTPDDIEKNLTKLISIKNFYDEVMLYLQEKSNVQHKEFATDASYRKALQSQKTQLSRDTHLKQVMVEYKKQANTFNTIMVDMEKNGEEAEYTLIRTDPKRKPGYQKWEHSILKYYKQEIQKNPDILNLPKILLEPTKILHSITTNSMPSSSRRPSSWFLRNQAPETTTPVIGPPETVLEYASKTATKTQEHQISKSTEKLCTRILELQEQLSQVDSLLTPEEQHTAESIFSTHVPQTLRNLQTLINIKSLKTPQASTTSNQILSESIQKLETILQRVDTSTYTDLTQQSKTITQIYKL